MENLTIQEIILILVMILAGLFIVQGREDIWNFVRRTFIRRDPDYGKPPAPAAPTFRAEAAAEREAETAASAASSAAGSGKPAEALRFPLPAGSPAEAQLIPAVAALEEAGLLSGERRAALGVLFGATGGRRYQALVAAIEDERRRQRSPYQESAAERDARHAELAARALRQRVPE